MLELEGVQAGYGGSRVLHGMSFTVAQAEAVALIGRNGMGKTTTIRAIMGQLPLDAGAITVAGRPTRGLHTSAIARAGIGLVPEGRHVFRSLTVEENLLATARPGDWTTARVYALFPRLQERRRQPAGTLSGGEQQMLATGRAILTNPRLLILDEATEGLAPVIRQEIWAALATLKTAGLAILVVDRNLAEMAALIDRHVIVEKGQPTWTGTHAAPHGPTRPHRTHHRHRRLSPRAVTAITPLRRRTNPRCSAPSP